MTPAGGRRRLRDSGHGHSHDLSSSALDAANPASPLIRGALLAIVAMVAVAAVASMAVLWPDGDGAAAPEGYQYDRVRTEVTGIEKCDEGPECLVATAEIDGAEREVRLPVGAGAPSFSVGDKILVNEPQTPDQGEPEGGQLENAQPAADQPQYSFLDFDRTTPMVWLAALFVGAVLLLSRWKGVASLLSLGLSVLAVTGFVLPALLDGANPLAIALTAAALIMIVTIYSTQGVSIRSSVALVGTLLSLAVAGGVGALFTGAAQFTGFSDDSIKFLVAILGDVDVRGLLLAGLIIGALGVLDDVTVTQTAAVWEIASADPTASRRDLFAAAMRIGRAHVSATVNTLVLAYVGASLPLLLLMNAMDASARDQVMSEGVAQEVVRSLAGSLGIVAAVPITTALAVAVVSTRRRTPTDQPAAP